MNRTIALSFVGTLLLSTAASAQGYQWQTETYRDDFNGGKRVATLTFGVPETDDVRVRATCQAGKRRAELIIDYNTGRLRVGTRLNARFLYDANVVHRERARVYAPESGEGAAGLRFTLRLDNPIWTILARYKYISVNANRRPPTRISLRGSGRAVDRFRSNCRKIFNTGGGIVDDERDNEENNVASAQSCGMWGRVRSRNANQKTTIRFTNRTSSERTVMWIDYQGQPKEYRRLAPGESYTQQTFVGHPWMFTDGPGNCKELFIPRRQGQINFTMRFDQ